MERAQTWADVRPVGVSLAVRPVEAVPSWDMGLSATEEQYARSLADPLELRVGPDLFLEPLGGTLHKTRPQSAKWLVFEHGRGLHIAVSAALLSAKHVRVHTSRPEMVGRILKAMGAKKLTVMAMRQRLTNPDSSYVSLARQQTVRSPLAHYCQTNTCTLSDSLLAVLTASYLF
jgi:hypothetical protein